jgi:uncharacterized protein (TIGR01244 family)
LELKRINDHISVSGQIQPEDVATLKDLGFSTIINNRPEGESPDQPDGADIEAAVKAAGLQYHAIPLGRDGVNPDLIARTKAALEGSDGKVFAFCRSGTRSTTLWALSQAGEAPAEEIISQAAEAGYDMSHLAGYLGQK